MPERQVNSTNSKGCTALHYACSKGHQKVAEKLLKAKADPSAKYVGCDCTSVIWEILDAHKSSRTLNIMHSFSQYLLLGPKLFQCIICNYS